MPTVDLFQHFTSSPSDAFLSTSLSFASSPTLPSSSAAAAAAMSPGSMSSSLSSSLSSLLSTSTSSHLPSSVGSYTHRKFTSTVGSYGLALTTPVYSPLMSLAGPLHYHQSKLSLSSSYQNELSPMMSHHQVPLFHHNLHPRQFTSSLSPLFAKHFVTNSTEPLMPLFSSLLSSVPTLTTFTTNVANLATASISAAASASSTVSVSLHNQSTIMELVSGNNGDNNNIVQSVTSSPGPLASVFDTFDAYFLYLSMNRSILTAILLGLIMVFTIVGNSMVIWAIFNYRPLHNVQNMFMVSLAVADIAVAVLVMPLNVAYNLLDKWIFGLHLCEMWLTSDVLCCTASILNLCAIALDRYWAIHDPINYAQKRTMRRVCTSIGMVWILSALISIPPLIGWNDWPEVFDEGTPCKLSEEKSYLIYSSSGSFFIPLLIMTVVYFKIFKATRRRLKDRAKASAMANLSNCGRTAVSATVSSPGVAVSNLRTNNLTKSSSNDDSSSSNSPKATVSSFTQIKARCVRCCWCNYLSNQHHQQKNHHHHHKSHNGNNNNNNSAVNQTDKAKSRLLRKASKLAREARIEIESASDDIDHNDVSSSDGYGLTTTLGVTQLQVSIDDQELSTQQVPEQCDMTPCSVKLCETTLANTNGCLQNAQFIPELNATANDDSLIPNSNCGSTTDASNARQSQTTLIYSLNQPSPNMPVVDVSLENGAIITPANCLNGQFNIANCNITNNDHFECADLDQVVIVTGGVVCDEQNASVNCESTTAAHNVDEFANLKSATVQDNGLQQQQIVQVERSLCNHQQPDGQFEDNHRPHSQLISDNGIIALETQPNQPTASTTTISNNLHYTTVYLESDNGQPSIDYTESAVVRNNNNNNPNGFNVPQSTPSDQLLQMQIPPGTTINSVPNLISGVSDGVSSSSSRLAYQSHLNSATAAIPTSRTSICTSISPSPNQIKTVRLPMTPSPLTSSSQVTAQAPSNQVVSVKKFWEEKQKISLSRERRATRILGIVMGVFVACWLPFFLMYVILPFCKESCSLPREAETFITWLGYINSAINPLIYCGFNRDFRRAFQKILFCKKV